MPVPRPPVTPPKVVNTTQTIYASDSLKAGLNTLFVSVAGGASSLSGAQGKGNASATNLLVSNSQNFSNTRDANGSYLGRDYSGNTLIAGTSPSTTMRGGAGNDCLYAAGSTNPVFMYGGSGNSTMKAGSGPATLVGGNLSNILVAGSGDQLLQGGSNSPTTTYLDSTGKKSTTVTLGNTLYGGTGKDTLIGGTGYNTLYSGSSAVQSPQLSVAAAKGSASVKVSSMTGLKVGQTLSGVGVAPGTVITAMSGNTVTLSKKMTAAAPLGASLSVVSGSNTLVGAGLTSYLVASTLGGNDSLSGGTSTNSTLIGGNGLSTLVAGSMDGASSWLQSGASSVTGSTGNSLYGSTQTNSSVTMVAASRYDTLSAGPGSTTFVINNVNKEAFKNATFSVNQMSTMPSARVLGPEVIALSSIPGGSSLTAGGFDFSDTILSGLSKALANYISSMAGAKVPVAFVNNLGNAELISLSSISGALGITSIKAGSVQGFTTVSGGQTLYGDTIDASNVSVNNGNPMVLTLDGSSSRMPVNLLGSNGSAPTGSNSNVFFLSQAGKNGYKDTIKGGGGYDTIIANSNTLFGYVDGGVTNETLGGGSNSLSSGDMLAMGFAAATLSAGSFVGMQNVENLSLYAGANLVGSLQGSGIQRIIGGTGSDTITANTYAIIGANASAGSKNLLLSIPTGTPQGSNLGFSPADLRPDGNGLASLLHAVDFDKNTPANTLSVHQIGLSGNLQQSLGAGSQEIRIYRSSDNLSTFLPGRSLILEFSDEFGHKTWQNIGINNADTLHINDLQNPYIDITLNGATNETLDAGTAVTLLPQSLFHTGQTLTGLNIPTGTTIQNITQSGTDPLDFDITLSNPLSGPLNADALVSVYHPQYLSGYGIPSGAYVTSTLSGEVRLAEFASKNSTVLSLQSIPAFYRQGQTLTGSGIAPKTTILKIDTLSNKVTLSAGLTKDMDSLSIVSDGLFQLGVSDSLTVSVPSGKSLNGWFANTTLDGSRNVGQGTTSQTATLTAATYVKNLAKNLNNPLGNPGEELTNRNNFTLALETDPAAFVHLAGDSLTALGTGVMLISPNDPNGKLALPFSFDFGDLLYNVTHKLGSILPPGGSMASASANLKYVIDSTLNASADITNTLVGNSGHTVYQLNNIPGTVAHIPTILLHDSLGTGYLTLANPGTVGEISFTGDNLTLDIDQNFSRVTPGAVNQVSIKNGKNMIKILPESKIDSNFSLFGGIGSDTLYSDSLYNSNLYIDGHKGFGSESLSSGQGDDTILGGSGNATIDGGDGNNSLIGGAGTNVIYSGNGNSVLDGGLGASTLRAVSGQNRMVLRNRNARILLNDNPDLNPQNLPLELTVDSYLNFDPIQSTEVNQFAPDYPDASPSITKSASFASSDLASFYSIKNFNLLADITTGIGAVYGVGNALDNSMTQGRDPGILNVNETAINNPSGGLMLGMGGNNTLVSWGTSASLYGFSNESYASPDLYAAAPTDTRTQDFITNVMGSPGNNYLFAHGRYSLLDGGPGYNNGLGSSASNTLIGTGGSSTFVVRHQADRIYTNQGGNVITNSDGSVTASPNLANTVYTTVDLTNLPDGIGEAIMVVADQTQYLRNFSGNEPVLRSNSGQDAPATYLSYGSAHANSSITHSIVEGTVTFSVPNSSQMQVQYGTYALNHFQSDNVPTPSFDTPLPRDQYFPLTVGDLLPDIGNPGMFACNLSWDATLMLNTNLVSGYTVLYQAVAYREDPENQGQPLLDRWGKPVLASDTLDADGNVVHLIDSTGGDLAPSETPFLTYLNGTSRGLQGTMENPNLTVDNLPTSFKITPSQSYASGDQGIIYDFNFQVTAVQLEHPFTFDTLGNEVATPVTLQGSTGNDMIWSFTGTEIDLNSGQNLGASTYFKYVNPVLASPLPPGTIPLAGPYQDSLITPQLYPVYMDGVDGNNVLISRKISDGSGAAFTIEAGTASNPQVLAYSGLNTMSGGKGSSTFIVANGTQTNFDLCIKYENETPADYTLKAPGVPDTLGGNGASLNGGQHNLIASQIDRIQLSDTTVSQGKFIDQLLLLSGGQFGEGNRLDNFIYDVNFPGNTLVGNAGRDSILATGGGIPGSELLIGGTAALGDNIAQAIAGLYGNSYVATTPAYQTVPGANNTYAGKSGYYAITSNTLTGSLVYTPVNSSTPTLQGSSTVFSAYRDADPVPAYLQGGPGTANTSQYWFVPGSGNYDPLRNSDTLVANIASTLDGGAGDDSLFGSSGDDWFVVSNGFSSSDHNNTTGTVNAGFGDVVVGNGGNDTICFTGSDLWWSGKSNYNDSLSYALSPSGDDNGGQSISNLILQSGAPNAINGYGNNSSTGQPKGRANVNSFGNSELGSNLIRGNEFKNTLDGRGVGGSNGGGYGVDTLTGGTGSDTFVVGANYRSSTLDLPATYSTQQVTVSLSPLVTTNTYTTTPAQASSDADYVTITDFDTTNTTDILLLSGTKANYAIGAAPSSFSQHNIAGGAIDSSHFGIYYINGTATPNLVAEVSLPGASITFGSSYLTVAGQTVTGASGGLGSSQFSWTSTQSQDLQTAGLNYLGFGAMYPLDGTSFTGFVQTS